MNSVASLIASLVITASFGVAIARRKPVVIEAAAAPWLKASLSGLQGFNRSA
ncbi:hypothetical protein [Halioglobus maricola]|uniref:hypothetical protein n=1 Tax=Halioglobus maricola TaxID=2601894 RepID=UPI001293CB95|nr:hypothetical protein [Halioglobus maricola]